MPHRCGFTNWTTTALGCDDFYTDPNAIAIYKNYVKTILTRVNTVTGLTYADDPTIMGALLGWSRMLSC
jgi:mannan endo-1,4-beta-mannosidase